MSAASSVVAQPAPLARVACFAVQAEADPGLMPRVLELFAKRGVVPQRWIAERHGRQGEELVIDIQVAGLDEHTSAYVARCLRALPQVMAVLTTEKIRA